MLITGVSGLLGNNLARFFRDHYEILGLYHKNPVKIPGIRVESIDLTHKLETEKAINAFKPDIVIHCSSLTNIDYCEQHPEKSYEANVTATQNLVGSLDTRSPCKLIYISTDSVYGGVEGSKHEESTVLPCNIYGETKLQGEKCVLEFPGALVIRPNIFGWNIQPKNSLAEWILDELQQGNQINGFEDARFSSIYTFELARILKSAINKNIAGTFNCGARDSCSKFDFAVKLAQLFGFDKSLIKPISIDHHHFKAKRGKKLSFSVEKIERELDIKLPSIDFSLEQFYRDFKAGLPAEIKADIGELKNPFKTIPYGRQWIDWDDIQAVNKVLASTNLTQGPNVTAFEESLKNQTGASFAVAVNSGTSALHIACLVAGVTKGDEVITSPNTFVASANCAVFCGARPVFADIDPRTYNIDPQEIERKISAKTKAVIPVHFAGQSADMERICRIVRNAEKKYGRKIYIIEDASHALGSRYKDTEVGSCVYSDMTVMSFHPVKHITTGEGGAVLSKDSEIQRRLRLFSSHGITRDPDLMRNNLGSWYYEQVELGYNYRITDIQSVLGVSQMKKLRSFMKRRREIVDRYNTELQGFPFLKLPFEAGDCDSNFHLYVIQFDCEKMGISRNEVKDFLHEKGILTQIHYIPVHIQPYYQNNFSTGWGDCPEAERYFSRCLSIPLYPAMSEDDINFVIKTIGDVAGGGI